MLTLVSLLQFFLCSGQNQFPLKLPATLKHIKHISKYWNLTGEKQVVNIVVEERWRQEWRRRLGLVLDNTWCWMTLVSSSVWGGVQQQRDWSWETHHCLTPSSLRRGRSGYQQSRTFKERISLRCFTSGGRSWQRGGQKCEDGIKAPDWAASVERCDIIIIIMIGQTWIL